MRQRACLAAGQPPGRQPQPPRGGLQVATDETLAVLLDQQNAAEAVGLEGVRSGIGGGRHRLILGG
ncbi:hypothetical protein D3C71_1272070 [compost metagenome]